MALMFVFFMSVGIGIVSMRLNHNARDLIVKFRQFASFNRVFSTVPVLKSSGALYNHREGFFTQFNPVLREFCGQTNLVYFHSIIVNTDLVKYYSERAGEYEKIYSKSERQRDLVEAAQILQALFKDADVLEIACGTGYWTQRIAQTAHSVLATDINEDVLEIARNKDFLSNVVYKKADLYSIEDRVKFSHLFGGFIFSHILSQDVPYFVRTLNNHVMPGGTIVLMDNIFVEGSNTPIAHTDASGNTFQSRKLNDGSSHLVLKNFPRPEFFMEFFAPLGVDLQYRALEYFWIFSYKVA
jgi:demethylmenaquinone methyltransferase/2-methoxy-6-polyprenyl-1,4-benzoquinol methylase